MRTKLTFALMLDMVMLGCLLVGLAYPLTGNAGHELLGLTFFVLCVAHTIVNRKWFGALRVFLKRKHSTRQTCNTVVNVLLLTVMIVFVASSVLQSQTLFPFFLDAQTLETRKLHTTLAWWGFVLVGLHVGGHWNVVSAVVRQSLGGCCLPANVMQFVPLPIVVYGFFVFIERDMTAKLLGLSSFEFWDFNTATGSWFAGYGAVLGMCIFFAHYGLRLCRPRK